MHGQKCAKLFVILKFYPQINGCKKSWRMRYSYLQKKKKKKVAQVVVVLQKVCTRDMM